MDTNVISVDYLQRSDTVLASVLNDVYDAVYVVDRHRRILFWNRSAEQLTGYSADEVRGHWCGDRILDHIDENGTCICKSACPLLHVFRTGLPVEKKVYPRAKDGHRFPTITHAGPIHNEAGEIVAAVEVFRDVTREDEFRLLQEKFNKLIARYVSSATFDEVMAQARGQSSCGARTRDLTVLYLDVVGFTTYSESRRPAEAVQMLNEVFGICDVITTECRGDVDKFIGDCIMAVFIDANDAVDAAKKVLKALRRLNEWRSDERLPLIRVRIGINSGLAVHGEVGTPQRKDLTVIGDVVNTASRLQQLARPNGICMSEAVVARLSHSKGLEPGGTVLIRGRSEATIVYHWQDEPNAPASP